MGSPNGKELTRSAQAYDVLFLLHGLCCVRAGWWLLLGVFCWWLLLLLGPGRVDEWGLAVRSWSDVVRLACQPHGAVEVLVRAVDERHVMVCWWQAWSICVGVSHGAEQQ